MINQTDAVPRPVRLTRWLLLLLIILTLTACDAQPTAQTPPTVVTASPSTIAPPTSTAEPTTASPTATTPATAAPTAKLPATITPTATTPSAAPQALLFARADDLYRADPDGGRMERLTEGGLLGWGMAAGDEWWVNMLALPPRVSPDGRRVAFSPDGDSVVVIDTQNPAAAPLTLPGSALFAWSPDSRRLAVATHVAEEQRAQLVVYDLATGAATPLLGEVAPDIAALVWSPDGRRVAFGCCFVDDTEANGETLGTGTGQVYSVDLASGRVENVGELWRSVAGGVQPICWTADNRLAGTEGGPGGAAHCSTPPDPSTSPDGQRRFSVSGPPQPPADAADVLIVEELSSGATWQRELEGDLWPIAWSPDGQFILLDDGGAATPIWRLAASGAGEIEVLIDNGRLLPTTIQPAPTTALLTYHSDGHLYTVAVDGGQSRRLTTQPLAGANEPFVVDGMFGFHPPVVSPNGRLLALNGNWGGAAVLDLVTGELIGIGRGQAMLSPSWSPDSRQLAYVTQDDRLCLYNLDTEPDDCPFTPEGLLMEVVWSPTGALIAAAVVTPPVEGSSDCCVGRVWLVDPATGATTDVAAFITGFEYAPGEAFQWLPDGSALAIKRLDQSRGAIVGLADGVVVTFDEWIVAVAPDGGTVLHPSGALRAADGAALTGLPGAADCAEFLSIAHAWSPDGRLAYTLRCGFVDPPAGANVLTVIDPTTGAVEWQQELPTGLFPVGWSPDGQDILLDDAAYGSPIWRLAADGAGEPAVIVEDGTLLNIIPAGE